VRAALIITTLCMALSATARSEDRRDAVHERADALLAWARLEPPWIGTFDAALGRTRVSVAFHGTTLTRAARELGDRAGISIVPDPNVGDDVKNTPVSLVLSDVTARDALYWLCRSSGTDYEYTPRAVVIDRPRDCHHVRMGVYDVRSLRVPPDELPAPALHLDGTAGEPPPRDARPRTSFNPWVFVERLPFRGIPCVMQNSWAPELGASIEERCGCLYVMQRPEVHRKLGEAFRAFERYTQVYVCVDVRLVEADARVMELVEWRPAPGVRRPSLDDSQCALLDAALAERDGARVAHAASVVCLNGQRAYSLDGVSRPEAGRDDRIAFRGTLVDVRPFVSFDRLSVRVDLRIVRHADAGSRAGVRKISTSVRCGDGRTAVAYDGTREHTDGAQPGRLVVLVTPRIQFPEPVE